MFRTALAGSSEAFRCFYWLAKYCLSDWGEGVANGTLRSFSLKQGLCFKVHSRGMQSGGQSTSSQLGPSGGLNLGGRLSHFQRMYGRGSKLSRRGYAGFGFFHLPGFHFGTGF